MIDNRSLIDKMLNKQSIEDTTANALVGSSTWKELDTEYGVLLKHKKTGCTLWWDTDGTPSRSFMLTFKNDNIMLKKRLPFGKPVNFYNRWANKFFKIASMV